MADLLGYLGDLSAHRLLVEGHRIELGVQVVDGLVKCLISLALCIKSWRNENSTKLKVVYLIG